MLELSKYLRCLERIIYQAKIQNAYFNKVSIYVIYFTQNKPSLRKLESFKINNVWIGDLIYDSYLKKFSSNFRS